MFVSLGQQPPRVYELLRSAGDVRPPDVKPGKYVVTIVPGPKCEVKKFDRYATTTTSTLVFDLRETERNSTSCSNRRRKTQASRRPTCLKPPIS